MALHVKNVDISPPLEKEKKKRRESHDSGERIMSRRQRERCKKKKNAEDRMNWESKAFDSSFNQYCKSFYSKGL
jgi:hypothetical protein